MTDFDQFVAAHVDDLLRTAYLIVWDEGEAEDSSPLPSSIAEDRARPS